MREIIKNIVYLSRRCTAVEFVEYVMFLKSDLREGKEVKFCTYLSTAPLYGGQHKKAQNFFKNL